MSRQNPSRRPLVIDSFAGGGGASTGIEAALGFGPDYAINHDDAALAMHAANHRDTVHLNSNIWDVKPEDVAQGRPVGLLWASPDCKHFSKAAGGKPRDRNIRDLAWVVVDWAERVKPDVILMENVEEFRTWGPVCEQGRIIKELQGVTFELWVKRLRKAGYKLQWRELKACDFGAPTIRKRFFMVARRDGRKIVWPKPTHGNPKSPAVIRGRLSPWRTAADIIDWSLPCPSIFDTADEIRRKHGLRAKRPLAEGTLRRIARGVMRYVVETKEPFLITYGQHGGACRSGFDPIHTFTASTKDQNAIVVPTLVQTGYGERQGQAPRVPGLEKPLGTVVAGGGKHALVAAFLAQHNAGPRMAGNAGRDARQPVSTITTTGTQQNVVAAHLVNMHGKDRRDLHPNTPHPTVCAGGQPSALVATFLQKYYGQGGGLTPDTPLHTVSTRDTFGLVTVNIDGDTYAIADIGMRMLTPSEQFRAQGFPDTYHFEDDGADRKFSKAEQTRMCGNSVCPDVAAALVRANCQHLIQDVYAAGKVSA